LRQMMDEEYPECILLAEANQWPQDLRPYFGDGDEFHMAFHFPLMPRMYKSAAVGDCTSIIEIMDKTPQIPDDCQWCIFLRNHDELTLEMVTEEEREILWDHYAPEKRMRLNLGIRRRLAPLLDGDEKKIELLYAILFSLPGAPIIYYGDEIGMGDNIWLNDRDGVRTPMQWSDGLNAGFSKQIEGKLVLPVIDEGPYSYLRVNVESQINNTSSLLNRLKDLMKVRKAHPVMSSQGYEFRQLENHSVLSVMRRDHAESILCLHNLSNEIQSISTGFAAYRALGSSTSGISMGTEDNLDGHVKLDPYTFAWVIDTGYKPGA